MNDKDIEEYNKKKLNEPLKPIVTEHKELTKEDAESAVILSRRVHKKLLSQGKITQERYEELEKSNKT